MTFLACLLGLTALVLYFVGVYHRDYAEILEQRIHAHRTAAAAYIVEVRKLEKRNKWLERRRSFVTRRAWARRSGYRALLRPWKVLP